MPILGRIPGDVEPVWQKWFTALVTAVNALQSNTMGPITGSPEGVVTAPQGTLITRSDGGATTTVYAKTSGGVTTPTNTGWTALS